MPITKIQFTPPTGRVIDAKILQNGSCELLIDDTESEKKSRISDSDLVLIEAESLSMKAEFLKHEPINEAEENAKELIIKAIKKRVKNFWKPKGDISFTADGKGVCYAPGKMPAVGKYYDWYEKAAKEFWPERNSRLGSKLEYGAFLGVLIKKLIEKGKTVEWAWNAVCNDSCELGHYRNSENPKHHDFEPTGSREICGLCDLANTYKILAWDNAAGGYCLAGGLYGNCSINYPLAGLNLGDNLAGGYWLAGGDYDCNSYNYPLAGLNLYFTRDDYHNYGVGWLVLS